MSLLSDVDLNEPQRQRIEKLVDLLGVDRSDVTVTKAVDLPPAWVAVTIGEQKGRPKHFEIDDHGYPQH